VISVGEAARRLNLSERRVRALCSQRRIPYARYIGRVWQLPDRLSVTPGSRGPALGVGRTDQSIPTP
jgi:excisionase family DNA binding protein